MRYWLFKSEPDCFSWDDLKKAPGGVTAWDGVRNYQARNFMRAMRCGDPGLFYHSGDAPEIMGVVRIVREAYPDHTAFDSRSNHHDPSSTPDNPRWYMVDVRLEKEIAPPLARKILRLEPELADMELMKKGSRLSVQPVEQAAFEHILRMAGISVLSVLG